MQALSEAPVHVTGLLKGQAKGTQVRIDQQRPARDKEGRGMCSYQRA
jgi:hypothetical protein